MFHLCRVVKQTLRSSGANVTEKHIEEVSLSALFLLEAAKKTDYEFKTKPQSIAHTTADSSSDVKKMRDVLTEKSVSSEDAERKSPTFTDHTTKGFDLMCKAGWIEGILQEGEDDCDEQPDNRDNTDVDLDYELHFN